MEAAFYEVFSEEAEGLKACWAGGSPEVLSPGPIPEPPPDAPPAPVLCVRTHSRIPAEWDGRVLGVLTRSSGFDHLVRDLRGWRKRPACGYLPEYCARAVAEQAVLMILALLRRLKRQIRQALDFDRDGLTGGECLGRRLLVVGVGRIGREVVGLGRALGMDVRGVDIDPRERDLSYVSLEEGVGWADVVVSAVPLTRGTRGLFSSDLWRRGGRGTIFVNISRGEVSPVRDLAAALEDGTLAGVGLDVFGNEGRLAAEWKGERPETAEGRCLRSMGDRDDVILTPHNAFNTREALERKCRQTVAAIETFRKEGRFPHEVPW